MSIIETRHHQLFPVLDAAQIETAKRFASGPAREFAPGEIVYDVGERDAPAWLVLKGLINVVRRDGLNHEAALTSLGAGQFSGEVSQLAGAATLAFTRAGPKGCTALPFDAAHVRALMVGSAEVGEIMMRAFILRRVGLIEEGGVGAVLVGKPGTPAFKDFSVATVIPTPYSTSPPMWKAALSLNGRVCSPRSCH
jgi:thioredoxin reductase (NADPH)